MKTRNRKELRPLTTSERREIEEYFGANAGFFHYTALLFLDKSEDAEDVIQESLFHVMRHVELFLSLDTARRNMYVARTIYNLCVDAYRKDNRMEVLSISDEALLRIPAPRNEIPGCDTHLTLLELAARLSEREWFVLQQLYLEGASKESVAEILKCSPDSIRSIASRARASARRIINPDKQGGEGNG